MIKKTSKIISIILYFLAAAALVTFLYIDFFDITLLIIDKVIIIGFVFLFCISGSYIRCKNTDSDSAKSIIKGTFFFLFVFYCIVIIDFTLVDYTLGRDISSLIFGVSHAGISDRINLIPFETIKLFINGYKSNYLSFGEFFENMIGNLLCFAPFAFFLPLFFAKIRKTLPFIITVALTVLVIETLQLVFAIGAADIDDLILNVLGALLAFFALKIKPISEFINKHTFGVWETGL